MTKHTQQPAPVVIGGRRFIAMTAETLTVKQSEHYLALYGSSGLNKVTIEPGEEPNDFAVRLLGELRNKGVVREMLGTLLLPEGLEPNQWTIEVARETAEFLGNLSGAENIAAVNAHTLTLVLDFFERGLTSFWTSQRSSKETERNQPALNGGSGGIESAH